MKYFFIDCKEVKIKIENLLCCNIVIQHLTLSDVIVIFALQLVFFCIYLHIEFCLVLHLIIFSCLYAANAAHVRVLVC